MCSNSAQLGSCALWHAVRVLTDQPRASILSVSQMDNGNNCRTGEDAAIAQQTTHPLCCPGDTVTSAPAAAAVRVAVRGVAVPDGLRALFCSKAPC